VSFHHPSIWWLLLLPAALLVWWRWLSPRRRPAVGYSSLATAARVGRSWSVRLRWIVPVLRTLAIAGLVVAMARPRKADEHTRIHTEGIAINLVVDRSGSMRASDFRIEGQPTSRLDAVKSVVRQFVAGGDDLPGRPDDLIGLIAFARYADSGCPLTLDHDHLLEVVQETPFVTEREEDGTAIGDAIALGVERLQSLDQRPDLAGRGAIQSKVMILLTDGESNVGDIEPLTAARMARALDIKVYTIGAGTDAGQAPVPFDVGGGRTIIRHVPVSIDEETLREIASITGAEYFRATDTDSLQEVYARIDQLERTEIEQRRYRDYRELAVQSLGVGSWRLPSLLAVVLVLLAAEALLASTRFQALP
jgi:Ca-activated chloride channel family protein